MYDSVLSGVCSEVLKWGFLGGRPYREIFVLSPQEWFLALKFD